MVESWFFDCLHVPAIKHRGRIRHIYGPRCWLMIQYRRLIKINLTFAYAWVCFCSVVPSVFHRVPPDLCTVHGTWAYPLHAVQQGPGPGPQHHDVWRDWRLRVPTSDLPACQPLHLPSVSPTVPFLRWLGTYWLCNLCPTQIPLQ